MEARFFRDFFGGLGLYPHPAGSRNVCGGRMDPIGTDNLTCAGDGVETEKSVIDAQHHPKPLRLRRVRISLFP